MDQNIPVPDSKGAYAEQTFYQNGKIIMVFTGFNYL
jgi:hypothetical protein